MGLIPAMMYGRWLFQRGAANLMSIGSETYVFFKSCVWHMGSPFSSNWFILRNVRCLAPKCMVGVTRSEKLLLRRNSLNTPTENPGLQRSASHMIYWFCITPLSSGNCCGPTCVSSRSCICMPTRIPKCRVRRSIYGLCCTCRSC